MQATQLYTVLLACLFFSTTASAQVFDPGPSDSSLFTNVYDLPGDVLPSNDFGGVAGEFTQINLGDNGFIESNFSIRDGVESNISGGIVGNGFTAHAGSELNITDGIFEDDLTADDCEVSITGGATGSNFEANNVVVNVSGGFLGDRFEATNGSVVSVSDGFIEDSWNIDSSVLSISGGRAGDNWTIDSSVLSISGGTVGRPSNIRNNSVWNISGGLVVGTFNIAIISNSTVNVTGGMVRDSFSITASEINVSDGEFSVFNTATSQNGRLDISSSTVNISGGLLGRILITDSTTVNISGGTVGDQFSAGRLCEVNISGGSVGSEFVALEGSEINISGGSVGSEFEAFGGSEVNLIGSDFNLDGVLLDDLTEGDEFTILDRDVTLTGLFADGSAFSFNLNSNSVFQQDRFDSLAVLTVTLAPESMVLGDVDRDGEVNFLDISPFIGILSTSSFLAEADCNKDGAVNFLDISPFIGILSGN